MNMTKAGITGAEFANGMHPRWLASNTQMSMSYKREDGSRVCSIITAGGLRVTHPLPALDCIDRSARLECLHRQWIETREISSGSDAKAGSNVRRIRPGR